MDNPREFQRRGPVPRPEAELIDALSSNFLQALDAVQFPAFLGDRGRRVRWQNAAAIDLVGDLRGKVDSSFVAPEDLAPVRDAFARRQLGALHTEYEITMIRADGTRVRVAISSVPLRGADQSVIGSFALARPVAQKNPPHPERAPELTARQRQTLTLLAAGCSTSQMAEQMGLSPETVRNHIKRIMTALEARSRVEAVAKARRGGLI
jgi:DNA-binding CsgD family transcriptional regulator